MNSLTLRNAAAFALIGVGLSQMAGEACGSRALRGLGAALAAAPSPKVFCDVAGLEGFASTFTLIGQTRSGVLFEKQITPEVYSRLRGSYNRRNGYGAALSFAPRLPEPMWRSVAHYGLGDGGPLRSELELPDHLEWLRVRIATQTRGRGDVWEIEAPLR